MSKAADRGVARVGGIALLPLSLVFLMFPAVSLADIALESGLLVHVQPVSSGWEWCVSPSISHCDEIVRTTTEEGPVEFVLFFMTGSVGTGSCLESIHTTLTWPPAWELVTWDACFAWKGWLDADGATHELYVGWGGHYPIGTGQGAVVPVARLVMNVVGPGRLDFTSEASQAVLRSNCVGPTLTTYMLQVFAEAGIQCGHLPAQCGWYDCRPRFYVPELVLSAPPGGVADGTAAFTIWSSRYCGDFTVDTHAPWCSASITSEGLWYLHVTADATGLSPGTYATAVEVIVGSNYVSRCLPVTFLVAEPTATSAASWGRVKSLYR